MPTHIRRAGGRDEPFLFEMLYEALFVPPGEPPPPRSVVMLRKGRPAPQT